MISLRRSALPALLALIACLAFAQLSGAYWKNSGTGSSTAATTTMPAGTAPTASVSATTVTVSIPQISVAGQLVGVLGGGYTVKRYPGTGGTGVTPPAGSCSTSVTGSAATLTCTETSAPRGDWKYTVSPTLFNWTTTESGYSSTVNVLPDPAGGLTADWAPAAAISLSWTAGSGATGYNIYRRTTAGSYNFATPLNGATPVSGTTYTDTTAVSGTSYNYVVRSVVISSGGAQLASANSNESAALTADGTAPTAVTLAAIPANLSGDVTFTGSANDTISGVDNLVFSYRSSPSGAWTEACTETAAPFECDFDSTLAADGLYDFRVTAFDAAGNQTSSTTQTNRRVDNTAPVASITDPGAYVRGTITLGGTASDSGSGLASLALEGRALGDTVWGAVCSSTTSPLSCSYNTTTIPDGSYEIQLVATDNAGNQETTATVTTVVDNTAPTIAVTSPTGVTGAVAELESNAFDATSDIATVQYQYKLSSGSTWTNACAATSSPYACNFNMAALAETFYDFRAIATDNAGNAATSASVTNVRLDKTAPTGVTITAPAATNRGTITINAGTPTDSGSGIALVTIQISPAGTGAWATACTDATPPYSCSFDTTTVADGLYDFRAMATDVGGNSTTSAASTNRRIDNTPPAATLTNPGSPLRATVALASTATDTGGSGVASVAFQYKLSSSSTWSTISTDTTSAYTASFATGTLGLNGTYDLRALATDNAGNQTASVISNVVIDNTAPTATDIQIANGTGTVGLPDAGDVVTFTFSEAMRATSILAGWNGSSTAVTVRMTNNANNDRLYVYNSANTAALPFGYVSTGRNYVTGTRNFTGSTMVMSGNTIVVTLGTPSGTRNTMTTNATATWRPSATALDVAGNAMSTAARNETGAADPNF